MLKFISIIFFLLLFSLNSKAKILEKDYIAIFTKYKIDKRDVAQKIINKCIKETGRDSLGRENLTITTNNNGEKVLDHKNEKAFLSCTYTGILKVIKPKAGNSLKKNAVEDLLLNNEISISVDGFRGASRRFVFEEKGYTRYDSLSTLGTTNGWRWSKTGQLRVFMDGKKTTWRISKDLNALSIKYSKDKTINYFLSYEKKLFAKKRREKEQKTSEAKKIAEEKRKEEERKKAEQKKLAEEKRKEEERLAEEKRKEEERLAEEKRKKEERLAEEKRKEEEKRKSEELEKKLALVKTSELEESQNLIKNIKSFIQVNQDEFEIVELAKYMIKVEPILSGSYTEQNKEDVSELKKFVLGSQKFKKYYENITIKENNKKLKIIDNEIDKLKELVDNAKYYLKNNFNSPFAIDIVQIIEISEKQLNDIDSLENLKKSSDDINKLFLEIDKYTNNYSILENDIVELKKYLAQYISTEIAISIVGQIELINETLKENNPEKIKLLILENRKFYTDVIDAYETKLLAEQKKLAEEKRKEEERLAEEKRKEEERLAEEKRKEEERLAEEKRKKEERLAEEKRKEEEAKLQGIFSKYNANNQFQKDLVRTLLKIPGINLENIKFSRGDRLIEADFSIKILDDFIGISGLQLNNLNKNVFYKLVKSLERLDVESSLFEEKKWFDQISVDNFSYNIDGSTFNSSINLKNLEFVEFSKNLQFITKISKEIYYADKNTEIGVAALMSMSLKEVIFKDLLFNDKNNNRKFSFESFDIKNFSLFDWGRWTVKNYKDQDKNTNTEVYYEYSDLKNVIFDKSEIMKYAQSYNPETFNFNNDYKVFLNFINSLGSGVTRNIVVKDLSTKNKIVTASSISLNSLKFDYIDNERNQKSLTEFDINFTGLDLSVNEVSPEFSNYFTLMGYDNIKFDFGTSLKWVTTKNMLNFDINLGITKAADLELKTTFSGLSAETLNIQNEAALGAYFLSNFKLNNLSLSLVDNSLRDNIFKLAAAESKMTTPEFKREIINQINAYTASATQTNLFNQYKKSVVKFINGSKKIVIQISPNNPISIAEVSPYFLTMDYDQIIRVLNLSIKN